MKTYDDIMKKVGIATVTYMDNYGSHLQSFAMQEVVREMGYEPEIIDISGENKEIKKPRIKYFLKHAFNREELRSYSTRLNHYFIKTVNKKYSSEFIVRHKAYKHFTDKNYDFSPVTNSFADLSKMCSMRYDSVIVGSDQNWRPANIAGNYYTLNFVPDKVNKIAYATSFGISTVRKDQENIARDFLGRIEHLSVRENSGKKIIKELTNRDIPVVCDPTLLMNKEKWSKYISDEPIINGNYIFSYFLGTDMRHRDFTMKLRKSTGYKIVAIINGQGYFKEPKDFADVVINDADPFDFLNLILYSKCVCTDSFHGCAFSINLRKNFYVFRKFSDSDSMSTNDRLYTLLESTGLQERMMIGDESMENGIKKIDYWKIEQKISKYVDNSKEYLRKALLKRNTDEIS